MSLVFSSLKIRYREKDFSGILLRSLMLRSVGFQMSHTFMALLSLIADIVGNTLRRFRTVI